MAEVIVEYGDGALSGFDGFEGETVTNNTIMDPRPHINSEEHHSAVQTESLYFRPGRARCGSGRLNRVLETPSLGNKDSCKVVRPNGGGGLRSSKNAGGSDESDSSEVRCDVGSEESENESSSPDERGESTW